MGVINCNRRVAAALEAPTPLLEIYQAGVRLCILSGRPKPPLHLTLSHCWVQIDILKLKRNNANDFFQNMTACPLAITFSRRIKVKEWKAFFPDRLVFHHYVWLLMNRTRHMRCDESKPECQKYLTTG
jgi:hypothetical protein